MSDELKQQLAAAEEQLVEMRRVLERLKEDCETCGAPDEVEITGGFGLDAALVWALCDKALSAAPKRGRVLWEHEAVADWDDYSALHCKHTVIRMPGHGAFPIKGKHITEETGKSVTVTVREEK